MATTTACTQSSYSEHVNPKWVELLDLLGMNTRYVRCCGSELFTAEGTRILDFLSGYGVYGIGHNHPRVIAALKEELDSCGPSMLQSDVPEAAGQLAARLCSLSGGRLNKVFFPNSGSEGIETVIKFCRAQTRRSGMLHADGSFHGMTCGALSLMGGDFWREGFGPLLPDAESVPFGNLPALEEKLRTRRFAGFVIEPVQAESGVLVPDRAHLRGAQELCRRYGTLFVLDEVQTGLHRTGPFLAAHHYGLDPDMVVLAKALSGGLVPVAAVLMTNEICDTVYGTLERAFVHNSTFSENSLAMRAGLAVLDVLEQERLGERAAAAGELLRRRLRETLAGFEMVQEIRGAGLLCAIAFQPPKQLRLRIPFTAFAKIHPGMFGQVVVMRLFREYGVLAQICGHNYLALKLAPPLVIEDAQIEEFVAKMTQLVQFMHSSNSFWSEALRLAGRAVHI